MDDTLKIALDNINVKLDSIVHDIRAMDMKLDTHNSQIVGLQKDVEYMRIEGEKRCADNLVEHDKLGEMYRRGMKDLHSQFDDRIDEAMEIVFNRVRLWLYGIAFSVLAAIIGYGIKEIVETVI